MYPAVAIKRKTRTRLGASKDPLLFTVALDGQFKFHWRDLENYERWDYLSLGVEIDLRIFELIEEDFF